jgi:hypothetical protein
MIGRLAALFACLAVAAPSSAQDAEVEFTEQALNRLVKRLADPSDGGIYQPTLAVVIPGFDQCDSIGFMECPGAGARIPLVSCRRLGGGRHVLPAGEPVSWQWWVMGGRYSIANGSMTLTATVRWRVGSQWHKDERTVGARFEFDPATDRLRIKVDDFKVPIRHTFAAAFTQTITTIDVGRLLGVSVPIEPQTFTVPLPNGTNKTLTGQAQSITALYQAGKAVVKVNVAFN